MRVFFAINIAAARQHEIDAWRARVLPALGRAIPAENLHITLHFIGEINSRQLELLRFAAAEISPPRFDLCLDMPGYFARARIFWIGASHIPPALPKLAKALRAASRKAGIANKTTAQKKFQPHMTLYRNCRANFAPPPSPPKFMLDCDGFALFESRAANHGVRYQMLHQWRA